MQELNEIQIDALTEVVNLGMGTAGASFSEMTGEEVELSVPSIDFMTPLQAANNINEQTGRELSGVYQSYQGSINGSTLLLFPEDKSLELVRLFLNDSLPLEALTEMEQEALSEIGNIILNASLSAFSNFLNTDLNSGLPNYVHGGALDVIQDRSPVRDDSQTLLFVKVEFGIKSRQISGYLLYILSVDSIVTLREAIDQYIASFTGKAAGSS